MKRLRSRLKSKLQSRAGETLAETLFALLISALALTMLAGAISSAANIITKSETVMTNYYAGINALGNPGTDSLSVSFSDGTKLVGSTGLDNNVTVKYAVNDSFPSKPVIAYTYIKAE